MSLTNNNAILKIGEVISIDDEYSAGRIRVYTIENRYKNEIPYAYPFLPYMLHVIPKVGEAVLLIESNLNGSSQFFYIGPIIHQPQFAYKDDYFSAISLLKGNSMFINPSIERFPETHGAYPKKDEIAIMGRKDSDLIFSDNDVRLRCGVHLTNKNNPQEIVFNNQTPSFLKIKYHNNKLPNGTNTSATIVSENINLISTIGNPEFNLNDKTESINDEEMAKIIETAHQLPYGDLLVKFLKLFLKAFNKHTHSYLNLPPVSEETYQEVNNFNLDNILSKNIKIN